MIVGFTGTQHGMAELQLQAVCNLFYEFSGASHAAPSRTVRTGGWTFVQGCCIGADAQAVMSAVRNGADIVGRPCTIENKTDPEAIKFATSHGRVYPPSPPLERNKDIVHDSELMIAAPGEEAEVLRSGTWATIRYAKKTETPLVIIYPSGRCEMFSVNDRVKALVDSFSVQETVMYNIGMRPE